MQHALNLTQVFLLLCLTILAAFWFADWRKSRSRPMTPAEAQAAEEELQAEFQGFRQTMAEFMATTNFTPGKTPGSFVRVDPTDESIGGGSGDIHKASGFATAEGYGLGKPAIKTLYERALTKFTSAEDRHIATLLMCGAASTPMPSDQMKTRVSSVLRALAYMLPWQAITPLMHKVAEELGMPRLITFRYDPSVLGSARDPESTEKPKAPAFTALKVREMSSPLGADIAKSVLLASEAIQERALSEAIHAGELIHDKSNDALIDRLTAQLTERAARDGYKGSVVRDGNFLRFVAAGRTEGQNVAQFPSEAQPLAQAQSGVSGGVGAGPEVGTTSESAPKQTSHTRAREAEVSQTGQKCPETRVLTGAVSQTSQNPDFQGDRYPFCTRFGQHANRSGVQGEGATA